MHAFGSGSNSSSSKSVTRPFLFSVSFCPLKEEVQENMSSFLEFFFKTEHFTFYLICSLTWAAYH